MGKLSPRSLQSKPRRMEKGPQSPGSARHQETILRKSRAARRGGEAGQGEYCKENPELSPKAVTAGIHYPLGDMFIASMSHCWAPGWEQSMAGAASNLDGVQAAHPAPHNGSSQASPLGPPHASLGADPALFQAMSGHVFFPGCFISHLRSDARALPLPAMRPAQAVPLCLPPMPPHAHAPG